MTQKSIIAALSEFDFTAVSEQDKLAFLQAVGLILKNAALDKKLNINEFLSSMSLDASKPEIKDSGFWDVYHSIFNLDEIISLAAMANTSMATLANAAKSNPNMTVAQAFIESMKKGA